MATPLFLLAAALAGSSPATGQAKTCPIPAGVYALALQIQEKVFNDILVIDEVDATTGRFRGSMTVPGNFSARIEEGGFVGSPGEFRFSITAKEGAGFKVVYEGVIDCHLIRGKALLDSGEILGTFAGARLVDSRQIPSLSQGE